jgi:hypothetical protein
MSGVFRKTLTRLGGGGQFPHPKYVWSPAGGWWGNTKDGPRNTVVAAGLIVATSSAIWSLGSSLEVSLFFFLCGVCVCVSVCVCVCLCVARPGECVTGPAGVAWFCAGCSYSDDIVGGGGGVRLREFRLAARVRPYASPCSAVWWLFVRLQCPRYFNSPCFVSTVSCWAHPDPFP